MRRKAWITFKGVATALGIYAVLLATALPANAQGVTARPKYTRSAGQTKSPFNLNSSNIYLLSLNAWLCGLQQIGEVCTSAVGSSVGGGGFWPQGTANQYIFNSGLQVAAVIGADGGAAANDTVATFFFNASGNGAGAPTPFLTGVPSSPTLSGEGPGFIFSSARPEDLANWPEACYLDNPVFGRVKTLSELDTCVQYWDGDPTASHFPDSHPMGLLVTQHGLLWSFPSNKDIMFFIYKFKNVSNTPEFRARNPGTPAGGWTLTNVYSAFAMDADVSGAEYSENYASVVPDLNMATTWQYDFETSDFVPYAPNFDAAPGFVGVKFLKSPVNTDDTARVVRVGADTRTVQPGQQLGLTFFSIFTNGGIMSDAGNGHQAFRYLSGQLLPTEKSQWCPSAPPGMCYVDLAGPADMRFYQSSGPFTLKPGQEAEIVVAYVAGAPVPGTYTKGTIVPVGNVTDTTRAIEKVMGRGFNRPGFPSLFANAKTAQAIFDANFVLPSSPTAPAVTVIPGDHQNTVIWDASPVSKEDPYCRLALDPTNALYDPNFRCKDFEGFRVYRKSNPSADWTPIAQFDLANGIVENVTVLEQVTTADGSTLVIKADTARVCPAGTKEQLGLATDFAGCKADTGLQFAIVDRGGSIPDPSNGPGLTNGVRYYYAVTAFDINSPQSGPSSLESARSLSAVASGVPRPNAAGTVAAQISAPQLFGSAATPLDTANTVKIDPVKGTFSGPQAPTNGLTVSFASFDPLLLSPGDMSIKIDSIVPLNGYEAVLGVHKQDNPNSLGISLAYFMTVTTPVGVQKVRKELTAPFGKFGAPSRVSEDVVNAPLPSNTARADSLKVSGAHYSGAFVASLRQGADVFNSGSEAVASLRTHDTDASGGSRWFVGTEPADPTLEERAGTLPGIDSIVNMAALYKKNIAVRWFVYLLSPVSRAVDYEVTWGAGGEITKVLDVTHNVDVPFNENYRGSWGVINEKSGDGILSSGDYWYVSPVSEWYCEVAGCHQPLEKVARIQPLSTKPPGGFGDTVAAADGTGFGLYIGGELFLFKTAALPASGTKWRLRTYSGEVAKGDAGYTFTQNAIRPPTITGLTAKITVQAATAFDVTAVDLAKVHTIPDPYYVSNSLETSSVEKRLQFVNLPPKAVIRIYSLSGILLKVLEHDSSTLGGTAEWDLRSRNNQFVASGVYFYHVETPDGKSKVGKFTVVQYAQ